MFAELEKAFEARRVELRTSPEGTEPGQVLVFETVGSVDDFYRALKRLPGLDWLGEWDVEGLEADDLFFDEKHPEKSLSGRVYLVMQNQEGRRQLQSLWKKYKEDPDNPGFERGRTKWRDLFNQLKVVREWGPEDRLRETGLDEDWRLRAEEGQERVRIEVELWPREAPVAREQCQASVQAVVREEGGEVLSVRYIPQIAYFAALVDLPITSVARIVEHRDTRLVTCDQVMSLRPVGQTSVWQAEEYPDEASDREVPQAGPGLDPIVAILDGLPMENHPLLAGRLIVDDPDDWASTYPVASRIHGTAMASVVLHGDLHAQEAPLRRPVYVRPVMRPAQGALRVPAPELVPEDTLPVDLVFKAVTRMMEGDGDQPPAARSVRIVNHAIADRWRPLDCYPSPWARLIDYLAWRYRLLFLVAAGNYPQIGFSMKRAQWAAVVSKPADLERALVGTLDGAARNRRLMSPAETINGLTAGAMHEDISGQVPVAKQIDPVVTQGLPSPISAQGPGFRRSIKPECLMPGGRQLFRESLATAMPALEAIESFKIPGIRVALPGASSAAMEGNLCGTSPATGLATHAAATLYEVLEGLRDEPGGAVVNDAHVAVLLKAMLVHGATWDGVPDLKLVHADLACDGYLRRSVGYGPVDGARVASCSERRVTLLGSGDLEADGGHVYRIPLPPGLSGKKIKRRVIITLAWFSPINCGHRAYRQAQLWFDPYGAADKAGSVQRLLNVSRGLHDRMQVRRGTVQHEIFEGEKASVFADTDDIQVQVNCRPEAGKLQVPVPYGIVVTIEVAEGLEAGIYEEIRDRLIVRINP